tara:strand:- start:3787 stop:4038 length:252 start_codon:yes stop_codon:yes gene_type:complete
MNKTDKYITIVILEYLNNEELINAVCINKFFNSIYNDSVFYEKIKYRKHPAVFNYVDNYCRVCNFKPLILTDFNIQFIRCSHI